MRRHLAHVDGLRALAALFVLANHGFRMAWPNSPAVPVETHPEGLALALTSWMRYGHFAVTTFIAISGYCLILPYVRQGRIEGFEALPFYGRRAWRILPTYYAALALSLLLIWLFIGEKTGTQWDAALPVTPEGIGVRIAMLQDVALVNQINNPLWSVATEVRIYLLMPLVVSLFVFMGPARAAVAVGVTVLALQGLGLPFVGHITFTYLAVFCMGAAAACAGGAGARMAMWAGTALLATAIAVLCALGFHQGAPWWRHLDLLVGAGIACLLVHCEGAAGSPITRALSWAPLVFVGGFSYSIYLMHFPLQALVWIHLVRPLGLPAESAFALFLVLGFPLVLAGCRLFYLLFERPVLRHRPSALLRWRRTPAAAR